MLFRLILCTTYLLSEVITEAKVITEFK